MNTGKQYGSYTCPTCGKTFERYIKLAARRKTNYCSFGCANKDGSLKRHHSPGYAKLLVAYDELGTAEAVAKKYGVGYSTVVRWLVDEGIRTKRQQARSKIGSHGYRVVRTAPKVWELEHRAVWEQAHGKMPKGYSIHHKNGDRLDNRLTNLELWERPQPAGQRANEIKHCKTCICNQTKI